MTTPKLWDELRQLFRSACFVTLLASMGVGCTLRPHHDDDGPPTILVPPEDNGMDTGEAVLCPVTGQVIPEGQGITYVHRGKLLYFYSQKALDQFLIDPDRYQRP